MSEHRVPMLRGRGRFPDPERSSDPAVRELVAALATLPAPAPRAHFRAELRAQLVAVAPRLVAEGREEAERATAAASPGGRTQRSHLFAGLRIAVASLAVVVVLLGGAVWLSRSALPGDALYGLKRASESAQLALASDPQQRAADLLGFAKTRVDEVRDLLNQPSADAAGPQAGGIGADQAKLIRSTLGSADDDLRQASRLLGNQSVHTRSATPLSVLLTWAPGQQDRLETIVDRLPAGDLRQAAQESAHLVAAATARAHALQSELGCSCLGGAGSDTLGPQPCQPCTAQPAGPGGPTAPPGSGTGSGHPHPRPTTAATSTTPAPAPAGSGSPATGSTGSTGSGTGSGTPTHGHLLPSLPLPSLPITVPPLKPSGSCTPLISLGPITIGCGLSAGI